MCEGSSTSQHQLRPTKCELFKEEVCYVGRLVPAEGVRIYTKDIAAVQALSKTTPTTVGDVRKLLGFLSYYRAYVQDFATIAKPLYDLLHVKGNHAAQPSSKQIRGGEASCLQELPYCEPMNIEESLTN